MIRQIVYRGPRKLDTETRRRPELGSDDVRLRVDACGVCGSDAASFIKGNFVSSGQVMGHEIAATVIETGGRVEGVSFGTPVAVRPLRTCGTCWYCKTGSDYLCGSSAQYSLAYGQAGGFADEVVIKNVEVGRDIVPVSIQTDPEDLLWAEPLAVVLHALERLDVSVGGSALVIGAGSVGLCMVRALVAAGVEAHVIETRLVRREAAIDVGAASAIAAGGPVPVVDAVVEASGTPMGLETALQATPPVGTVVLLGLGDHVVPVTERDVRIRGSFAYRHRDFERAVRLIDRGIVRLGSLITHRYGLEATGRAIETSAHSPEAVKVAVIPTL